MYRADLHMYPNCAPLQVQLLRERVVKRHINMLSGPCSVISSYDAGSCRAGEGGGRVSAGGCAMRPGRACVDSARRMTGIFCSAGRALAIASKSGGQLVPGPVHAACTPR
jgi:hypothetical protein